MKFALDTTLLLFIHTKGCMFVFYKKEIYCCYLYNSIKVLESPGILSKLLEKSRNFDGKSPGKSGKKSWKVLEFKLIFFFFFLPWKDWKNLSNKSNLKRCGASQKQETVSRYFRLRNIWDKLQFLLEIVHHGKRWISVFPDIFSSTDKIFFSEEDWALSNNFMKS